MKDIPQPIKDAAEKVYPLTGFSEIVDYDRRNAQLGFIAGATHPDTEKYYREKHEEEFQGFLSYLDDLDGNYMFHSFSEGLAIYRQSLTKNKQDEH